MGVTSINISLYFLSHMNTVHCVISIVHASHLDLTSEDEKLGP